MRYKIAPSYSADYLETTRPQPLIDNCIESLIEDILAHKHIDDVTDQVYSDFKSECSAWIQSSTLNHLTGFDAFLRQDISIGCTQFIDTVYMNGPVQTIQGDYRYHERLGLCKFVEPGLLTAGIPLLIAMPFPQIGAPHTQMNEILDECLDKNIPVHLDGAWVTCCKDIEFNFNHPSIHSFAISLSKGLGLGWNRVGIRWQRQFNQDAITIMNDYHMNNRALVIIALYFLRNLPADYLWKTHAERYHKVCRDFNLKPTNSVYLALRDGHPVGLSPLIRYLENADA